MKNQLFTKHSFLSILMTLVLAFSVQGVCEALTLTKTSGDFQSGPVDSTFKIVFSVSLESNSTARYNSLGQQIDEYGNEIDSSGYLIEYIGSSKRRFISGGGLPMLTM